MTSIKNILIMQTFDIFLVIRQNVYLELKSQYLAWINAADFTLSSQRSSLF